MPLAGPVGVLGIETVSEVELWNAAVTALFWLIVTVHDPVPEQFPDQPVKVDPDAGVAVRVTVVFGLYEEEAHGQFISQFIPGGVLTTEPFPEPPFVTVRVNMDGDAPPVYAPGGPEELLGFRSRSRATRLLKVPWGNNRLGWGIAPGKIRYGIRCDVEHIPVRGRPKVATRRIHELRFKGIDGIVAS